ncbi:MAG: tetratricopeptide repeat protein [Okeania sp. SIO3B5]|uniref:tetratricopeptide repeat protein n=1 Tax=Okeania sp. SIO3B5 TaxID=2607811 RepID=UPI001400F582|nr:tetratricopeptide repeat protein [Okeania sp. SIO3B5]NEO56621.1 tetratricopeptide repeat protein [Okeania sp. SIO3B5]
MALLQFNASQNYAVASLGNSTTFDVGDPVYVAGFPFEPDSSDANGFVFQTGRISFVLQQPLEGGYLIGYTADVEKGMSGGPILNSQGEVIGINGIFAHALSFSHPYIYEDGTPPNDDLKADMRRSSWGVPIDKLAQLAPQFASDNSVPVRVEKPSPEPIAQLIETVDGIAQQISVLITRSDLENGSGVIVAKEGNAYYFILYQWKRNILSDMGLFQEALEAVDKAVQINPDNSFGYFRRAWTRVALEDSEKATWEEKDYEEAIADINKALELNPGNAFYYVSKGAIYTRKEDYAQAIEYLNKAIEAEPDFATAYAERGLIYAKQGNRQKFTEDLEKALRLRPDNVRFYTIRGNGYFALEEKQKGIDDYDKAISLDSEPPHQSYNLRGKQLFSQEDYEAALVDYNKAIELNPDRASYYSNRGDAYYRQGDYKAALADYNKAIELKPGNTLYSALLYNSRGRLLFQQKDYEAALTNYNKAIELKPGIHSFYPNRGLVLFQQRDYEAALADYKKAIELKPDIAIYYLHRGKVFFEQKDYKAALADYNRAIELKPDNAFYYSNRGKVFFEQKDYEAALADYNRAIELKPDDPSSYHSRGLVYYEQKKPKIAIADFTEAIRLQPEKAAYYESLALSYSQNGEKLKAGENFQKAATLYEQQGNTEGYQTAVKRLEEIQQFLQYYIERGDKLYQQKDYEAAIKSYTLGLSKANVAGIGVNLGEVKLGGKLVLQITQVNKDSPAFNVGLKSGDIILEADGKLLLSDNADTLSSFINKYIKGEVGTEVTLKILREIKEFTLTVIRVGDKAQVAKLHSRRASAYSRIGNNQKANEDLEKAAALYREQQ